MDSATNVYLTGYTTDEFDGQTNGGWHDAVLMKFTPEGQHIWSRIWGSPDYERCWALCVDSEDGIYAAGDVFGMDYEDIMVAKYSPDGIQLWWQTWGSSAWAWALGICAQGSSRVYVVGSTDGAFDGETNAGDWDCWLSALSNDGGRAWTRIWGSAGEDQAWDVAVDDAGSIYVCGDTTGSMFLCKFDPMGSQEWMQTWGEGWSYGGEGWMGLAVGGSNAYVGTFAPCELDGQSAVGNQDLLLTKWNLEYRPRIQGCAVADTNMAIDWSGAWNCEFDLESTTNLPDTNAWAAVPGCTNMAGAENMSITNTADAQMRCYRVKARESQ